MLQMQLCKILFLTQTVFNSIAKASSRLAIHIIIMLTISVIPAAVNKTNDNVYDSWRIRYPNTGDITIRISDRRFGTV